MKKPTKKHGRQFLNPGEGLAAIQWEVKRIKSKPWTHPTTKKVLNGNPSIDADITLSDCSRQITLEFSVWGKKEIKQRKQKLDRFEKQVQAFIEEMRWALEWVEEEFE